MINFEDLINENLSTSCDYLDYNNSYCSDLSGSFCIEGENYYDTKILESSSVPSLRSLSFSSSEDSTELFAQSDIKNLERRKSILKKEGSSRKRKVFSFDVTFTDVKVRVHERILCEHPACSHGPSIGIGWKSKDIDHHISVDEWEAVKKRVHSKNAKNIACHFLLSSDTRVSMLFHMGYTLNEMEDVVNKIDRIKYLRSQSVLNVSKERVEEVVEIATKKMKRLLSLSRSPSSSGRGKSAPSINKLSSARSVFSSGNSSITKCSNFVRPSARSPSFSM